MREEWQRRGYSRCHLSQSRTRVMRVSAKGPLRMQAIRILYTTNIELLSSTLRFARHAHLISSHPRNIASSIRRKPMPR